MSTTTPVPLNHLFVKKFYLIRNKSTGKSITSLFLGKKVEHQQSRTTGPLTATSAYFDDGFGGWRNYPSDKYEYFNIPKEEQIDLETKYRKIHKPETEADIINQFAEYVVSDNNIGVCPICMEPLCMFNANNTYFKPPHGPPVEIEECGHRFHRDCLLSHCSTEPNKLSKCSCPLDRIEFNFKTDLIDKSVICHNISKYRSMISLASTARGIRRHRKKRASLRRKTRTHKRSMKKTKRMGTRRRRR